MKTRKKADGTSVERALCRINLLDDSSTDAEVTAWGEIAERLPQRLAPGQVLVCYRLKLQISSGAKSLTATDDTYFEVIDKPDGMSDREDKLLEDKGKIFGEGAQQTATSYEGGADVSSLTYLLFA